jgi:hypothetical protein
LLKSGTFSIKALKPQFIKTLFGRELQPLPASVISGDLKGKNSYKNECNSVSKGKKKSSVCSRGWFIFHR